MEVTYSLWAVPVKRDENNNHMWSLIEWTMALMSWRERLVGKVTYCSSIVTKHHDQDNVQKKAFNWAYVFRELESTMVPQRSSGRNSWLFTSLSTPVRSSERHTEKSLLRSQSLSLQWQTSSKKATSSNLSQTISQLGYKNSNIWVYGPHSFSAATKHIFQRHWSFFWKKNLSLSYDMILT